MKSCDREEAWSWNILVPVTAVRKGAVRRRFYHLSIKKPKEKQIDSGLALKFSSGKHEQKREHTTASLRKILSIHNSRSQYEKSPATGTLHHTYRDASVGYWLHWDSWGGASVSPFQPPILLGLPGGASGPLWMLVLRINKNKSLKHPGCTCLWEQSQLPYTPKWARRTSSWSHLEEFQTKGN